LSAVPRAAAPQTVNVAAPTVNVAAPSVSVAAPAVTVNVPATQRPVVEGGMVGGPAIVDLAVAMRELNRDRPKGMTMTVNRDQNTGLITSTNVTFEY